MSILHATLPGPATDRRRAAEELLAPIRALYPFQPRFLEHDGLAQHYLDEGPRDAPALLFLHGNPTWSFLWRDVVGALADRWRCVAPDHVGCGLSDKPQRWSYRLADHAENTLRLVEALGLERVTLVVHDWGGAIGMGLARRAPGRIARLVVLNTAAFRAPRIPLRIAVCRTPLLGKVAVRGLNAFARAATVMTTTRPLAPEVKRGYLLPYGTWEERIATHAFVADIPMRPDHPSWPELVAIEEALPRFADRPAAILWGERDWCFTPRFRERWERILPAARVHRYGDAGHYVPEDAGGRLVHDLERFLEETEA